MRKICTYALTHETNLGTKENSTKLTPRRAALNFVLRIHTKFAILRWTALCLGLAVACYWFAVSIHSAWQTVAPPGEKNPMPHVYASYEYLGQLGATLSASVLLFLNVRPNYPYLRSRWTIGLLVLGLTSLTFPSMHYHMAIDRCLDNGGRWSYTSETCRTTATTHLEQP